MASEETKWGDGYCTFKLSDSAVKGLLAGPFFFLCFTLFSGARGHDVGKYTGEFVLGPAGGWD